MVQVVVVVVVELMGLGLGRCRAWRSGRARGGVGWDVECSISMTGKRIRISLKYFTSIIVFKKVYQNFNKE